MKKMQAEVVRRTVNWMVGATAENWEPEGLLFRGFRVNPCGEVDVFGIGAVPLDWTHRRSVARAFRRYHGALTKKLAKEGRDAATKTKG